VCSVCRADDDEDELMQHIELTRDGHVLVATIDRADSELNAIDGSMHRDLMELMATLRDEREARAVLLTARGRAFSAGGDFGWFEELRDPAALHELHRDAKRIIWDLVDVDIPIVVALNGPAVGLGASIALLCDVLVMADSAVIADPHVVVGIVAGDGGTAIWPLALGPMLAKRYLLTGDPVDAATAVQLGLAVAAVASKDLPATGLHWAHRLAAMAPLAVRGTKAAVNATVKRALLDSFDLSTALEIPTFLSHDHREALAARAARRPPAFEGR
jgi:enoyl-CoA hydratase